MVFSGLPLLKCDPTVCSLAGQSTFYRIQIQLVPHAQLIHKATLCTIQSGLTGAAIVPTSMLLWHVFCISGSVRFLTVIGIFTYTWTNSVSLKQMLMVCAKLLKPTLEPCAANTVPSSRHFRYSAIAPLIDIDTFKSQHHLYYYHIYHLLHIELSSLKLPLFYELHSFYIPRTFCITSCHDILVPLLLRIFPATNLSSLFQHFNLQVVSVSL